MWFDFTVFVMAENHVLRTKATFADLKKKVDFQDLKVNYHTCYVLRFMKLTIPLTFWNESHQLVKKLKSDFGIFITVNRSNNNDSKSFKILQFLWKEIPSVKFPRSITKEK